MTCELLTQQPVEQRVICFSMLNVSRSGNTFKSHFASQISFKSNNPIGIGRLSPNIYTVKRRWSVLFRPCLILSSKFVWKSFRIRFQIMSTGFEYDVYQLDSRAAGELFNLPIWVVAKFKRLVMNCSLNPSQFEYYQVRFFLTVSALWSCFL